MAEDLSDYRKSYEKDALYEASLLSDPMEQFEQWFHEVEKTGGVEEVNAMNISTVSEDGFPKSRVVLLKKFDKNGFYFYTNYHSEKGKAIEKNNKVSLAFFWPNMERQVIIKGFAEKTSEADSTEYFHSRPKGSQIGAVASPQSEVIESRLVLAEKLALLKKQYENSEVPKPKFWGGYLIRPISVEFWQGRANRLHDRIRYSKKQDGNSWKIERLAP